MQKILITGGFGYLGGRIAQTLTLLGYEVILGSRRQREIPSWLPQAKVVETRWEFPSCLSDICNGVDAIIHLAGMNAQDCVVNPPTAIEFSAMATTGLLKAAVQMGVQRFIYFSTAHVYCSPLQGEMSEDTCPSNFHPYATSHRAAEDVVRAAHQRREIDGLVIRLSNACGAPTHSEVNCWMLLANDLCRQVVETRQLVLRSSGQQQRNFIALADVSRCVAHFLAMPRGQFGDGVFNLGGEGSIRVVDFAERIALRCEKSMNFAPRLILPSISSDDAIRPLEYRIDKLKGTGFVLKGNIDDEIDDTIDFCRRTLN